MTNKSAVVIIKRGDQEMANAMVDGLNLPAVQDSRMIFLERENFFLKRQRTRTMRRKIREAQLKYGNNYIPKSNLGRRIREGWALIEYGLALFAERFMTIEGVNRRGKG